MKAWFAGVVVALLVALAALVVVNQRAGEETSAAEQARTQGVRAVTTLLSYTPEDLESGLEDELGLLGGDFREQYETLVRGTIAPAAEKGDVTTVAKVAASAVVEPGRDETVLLVFVNVTTQSAELDEPRVTGSRLRVVMSKSEDRWRISGFEPI